MRLGSVSWQLVCQTFSWKPTGKVKQDGCGSQPHFSQVALKDIRFWSHQFAWQWRRQYTPDYQTWTFGTFYLRDCKVKSITVATLQLCFWDRVSISMYRGWPFYFFPSFTVRKERTTIFLWHGRSNAYLWFAPSNEGSALLKVVMQNHLINSWTEYNLWKVFLTDGFHSLCKAQCFQLSFTVHTLLGTKSLRFCPISPRWLF